MTAKPPPPPGPIAQAELAGELRSKFGNPARIAEILAECEARLEELSHDADPNVAVKAAMGRKTLALEVAERQVGKVAQQLDVAVTTGPSPRERFEAMSPEQRAEYIVKVRELKALEAGTVVDDGDSDGTH